MRYRVRVVQHRTLDIIVEADTREEAEEEALEKGARLGRSWNFTEAAYECAFVKEEEQR